MTNFQSDTNRTITSWLTPERAVLVVPILAGLGFSSMLVTAVITPQILHLRERQSVVQVLEQKSKDLPDLVEALDQLRVEQAQVMAQQQRLLALIAGTEQLETFLAQLNDLADKHQVVVSSTDPGEVEVASALGPRNDALVAADPLLMQGLERRTASIQVKGGFVQVLNFLRSLEKLQVFVVTDDLTLMAEPSSADEPTKVRLGLTLLAYGAVKSSFVNGGS